MERTRRKPGVEMQFKILSARTRLWGTKEKQKASGGLG